MTACMHAPLHARRAACKHAIMPTVQAVYPPQPISTGSHHPSRIVTILVTILVTTILATLSAFHSPPHRCSTWHGAVRCPAKWSRRLLAHSNVCEEPIRTCLELSDRSRARDLERLVIRLRRETCALNPQGDDVFLFEPG